MVDRENGGPEDSSEAPSWTRAYGSQWRSFLSWCASSGSTALPASSEDVVAYLRERANAGARSSTLRVAAAAIASAHTRANRPNPCEAEIVQTTLVDVATAEGPASSRSLPLTLLCYREIRRVALQPRMSRGGHMERPESARQRGAVDVAMIGLMRDARLRVREAASLKWKDIEWKNIHGGQVRVGDVWEESEYRVLSMDTLELLQAIRGDSSDDEPVLGMMPNQISARIGAAALQAGLGPGYSGESPRLGMIQDLETFGVLLLGNMIAEDSLPDFDPYESPPEFNGPDAE